MNERVSRTQSSNPRSTRTPSTESHRQERLASHPEERDIGHFVQDMENFVQERRRKIGKRANPYSTRLFDEELGTHGEEQATESLRTPGTWERHSPTSTRSVERRVSPNVRDVVDECLQRMSLGAEE